MFVKKGLVGSELDWELNHDQGSLPDFQAMVSYYLVFFFYHVQVSLVVGLVLSKFLVPFLF